MSWPETANVVSCWFPIIPALCLSSCLVTAVFRITTMRVLSAWTLTPERRNSKPNLGMASPTTLHLNTLKHPLNILEPLNLLNGSAKAPISFSFLILQCLQLNGSSWVGWVGWVPRKMAAWPALFDEPPRDAQFAGQQSAHVPHGRWIHAVKRQESRKHRPSAQQFTYHLTEISISNLQALNMTLLWATKVIETDIIWYPCICSSIRAILSHSVPCIPANSCMEFFFKCKWLYRALQSMCSSCNCHKTPSSAILGSGSSASQSFTIFDGQGCLRNN